MTDQLDHLDELAQIGLYAAVPCDKIAELVALVRKCEGALNSCYGDWEGDKLRQHYNIELALEAMCAIRDFRRGK